MEWQSLLTISTLERQSRSEDISTKTVFYIYYDYTMSLERNISKSRKQLFMKQHIKKANPKNIHIFQFFSKPKFYKQFLYDFFIYFNCQLMEKYHTFLIQNYSVK